MAAMNAGLERMLARWVDDPFAFVTEGFDWSEIDPAGGGVHPGPDAWQAAILRSVRDSILRFKKNSADSKTLDPDTAAELLANAATDAVQTALLYAVASGHGIGKAIRSDVIVETPSGKRRWGSLGVGDLVFAADGHPTPILATRHYSAVPMYRVSFDDGSSCDVSSGHLWAVRGRNDRRNGSDAYRVIETIDLVELGVKRPNGVAQARQWEIPVQGAAQFDERHVLINPYFVGLWLGDGCKGQPQYAKPFPELVEKLVSLGCSVSSAYADGMTHRLLGVSHLFKDPAFSLGSHERYIPDDYKFNSVAVRMTLFAGLCDSDGEVHGSGSIGYSTTSKRLAEDVIWLARSLGCKAMMQPSIKRGAYRHEDGTLIECRDCWRVTINCPFNPFTIAHRRDAYKPSEKRYITRWIDSIEPIPNADGMCIEVAGGLYLANDFIVTHNSALVSWLVLWAMLRPHTRGAVTANTADQLATKTWPELATWFNRCAVKFMWTLTATRIASADETKALTWRIDALPWSETRTEAFAGLHNKGKRLIIIFDEASAIPDIIWETIEGALTDSGTSQIMWFAFGNPTRNTGRFKECFGRLKHRWNHQQIDSRTSRLTNKAQIANWIEDYGDDSDFVRVRVKGMFPRAGSTQLIPLDVIEKAQKSDPISNLYEPLILAVDVARFGDDQSIILRRRGRDARLGTLKFRGIDTMQLAARVAAEIAACRPDAVFIDEGGVGGGVVDRLRQLGHSVVGVNFGGSADGPVSGTLVANKRAEMWVKMRDWLSSGGAIDPADHDLAADLGSIEYSFDLHNQILLESKKDMKKRGLASPDCADALAMTFAHPVALRQSLPSYGGRSTLHRTEWDPMADM